MPGARAANTPAVTGGDRLQVASAVGNNADWWHPYVPANWPYGTNDVDILGCLPPAVKTRGEVWRSDWRSKRMCAYFVHHGLPIQVLARDRRGQEITISAHIKEWSPTQTVRDVITGFADHLSRSWWEKIVVYQDDEAIQEHVALGELADFDGIVQLTFASHSEVQHWANCELWGAWLHWQAEAARYWTNIAHQW